MTSSHFPLEGKASMEVQVQKHTAKMMFTQQTLKMKSLVQQSNKMK
jgi:hypothetical protein